MLTSMKGLSGLLQFFIGFILGVTLFVGGISLAGYLVFNRFAANPEKPLFPEEQSQPQDDQPSPTGTESPQASPSPSPSPSPTEELPSGAYKAKVIWNGGLNVRTGPDRESDSLATINYNDEVVVLATQGEWSKLRLSGGTEGWVRSGNLEKLPTP
ncbi:SH3 domain-containing protein [Synechocystis sp. CACIAM 05]|nr:SH3 domain-containing protein [Synechocystis sp. CACIAM 05]